MSRKNVFTFSANMSREAGLILFLSLNALKGINNDVHGTSYFDILENQVYVDVSNGAAITDI